MSQIETILHDAYQGNLTSPLGTLQAMIGVSDDEAAALCFVSPQTYRRWRSNRDPNPCALRLLGILAGYVPWSNWQGWFYNSYDGKLYHPDLKYGFSPDDVMRLYFTNQTVHRLENENLRLQEQLKEAETKLQAISNERFTDENVIPFPGRTKNPTPGNGNSSDTAIANTARDPKLRLRDRFWGFIRRKSA